MHKTNKHILSEPVNADFVLPIADWGSKMKWTMEWVQGHVKSRNPDQEDWMDDEWANINS